MNEKICPVMSRPKDDGNAEINFNLASSSMISCQREKCQLWTGNKTSYYGQVPTPEKDNPYWGHCGLIRKGE